MRVELCEHAPVSGSAQERRFDAVGSCTWVRFVTDDGDEWAGVFGRGSMVDHVGAVLCGDGRTALIIAGGQGYVVDAHAGTLHHKTACDTLCEAVAVPGRPWAIACDYTGLYAVSPQGELWRSPRLALDGIRLGQATGAAVAGEAWCHDGWRRFSVQFDGWRIDGDVLGE